MNDSKDFQDAESVRSGNSHVTSRPVSFPPHPIPEGMLRLSFVSPRRKEGPPHIWDTPGISGNVFANPQASSTAPYPQELNPWRKIIDEPLHMSTAEKSERPERDQDLRCQSGPSAKDSVLFSGGDSSNNYGADQQRLQISDLHFDKFPTPATFACLKIRFKTEVCTCRFGEKCSFAHRQVDEQPTKRSKSNNDKSDVAMLKKGDWQERELVTDQSHDRSGQLDKR